MRGCNTISRTVNCSQTCNNESLTGICALLFLHAHTQLLSFKSCTHITYICVHEIMDSAGFNQLDVHVSIPSLFTLIWVVDHQAYGDGMQALNRGAFNKPTSCGCKWVYVLCMHEVWLDTDVRGLACNQYAPRCPTHRRSAGLIKCSHVHKHTNISKHNFYTLLQLMHVAHKVCYVA